MTPLFTIHAGEYLVGSVIEEKFKDLRVWVPSKDTGIDLLLTDQSCKKTLSVQVKFSKDFMAGGRKNADIENVKSGGWWKFNRAKISKSTADLWVLVLYQFQQNKTDFVIISPEELLAVYDGLNRSQESIQSYIWVTMCNDIRCWETRGLKNADKENISKGLFKCPERDLTTYLNNWDRIKDLSASVTETYTKHSNNCASGA